MDDLNTLFPGEVVKVAGEEIKLHPFYFGQLSQVVRLCKPIVDALLQSAILTIIPNADNTSTIKLDSNFIPKSFQIMADGGESIMQLIAFAIGKERAFLDKVDIDEGINLAQKVYEVNSSFFVKRVMPMLEPKLSKFITTGETSSPDSSAPATGGVT